MNACDSHCWHTRIVGTMYGDPVDGVTRCCHCGCDRDGHGPYKPNPSRIEQATQAPGELR
jgi:hypothetical protein